ncbi:hypothetical protein HFO55_07485 [Rhizobium leguminosarum]|uniref:hypothetical protein n=1 Tax=Rhizobium leguminosarum TaxID=384 RepID=UPI001C960BAB|nr:hypothetical protein [Rhizobium leguminosarum]MBY5567098.1 hypothetical protein [Rhizobium leguminosarum]MBY5574376.1 hypothetical protein [Rhizobium leguminosarum]
MSEISVHFSFPKTFRADEVVGNLTSFDVDEAKEIANRMVQAFRKRLRTRRGKAHQSRCGTLGYRTARADRRGGGEVA